MYLLYMSDHEYRTPLSTAREMTPLTPNIVGKYMRLTQGNWQPSFERLQMHAKQNASLYVMKLAVLILSVDTIWLLRYIHGFGLC